MHSVYRCVRQVIAAEEFRDLSDQALLHRFCQANEETAFAVLVRRHGPMVLRLCRRILQHEQDAEDAAQAVFLVLSQKAKSLCPRQSLSGWLYTVAYRTAHKANIKAARRRTHEQNLAHERPVDPLTQLMVSEIHDLLHQEIARLPDKFRDPLVLCYLQGLTRDEAARRLNWPPKMVKTRLEQARERLRLRMNVRGVTLSGTMLASLSSEAEASAIGSLNLFSSTVKAGTSVTGISAPPTAPLSQNVTTLAEGVMNTMMMNKIHKGILMALLLSLLCFGVLLALRHTAAEQPHTAPKSQTPTPPEQIHPKPTNSIKLADFLQSRFWRLQQVDLEKSTITVDDSSTDKLVADGGVFMKLDGTRVKLSHRTGTVLTDVSVTENAQVSVNGRSAKLVDLKPNMLLKLLLSKKTSAVRAIRAIAPPTRAFYVVEKVDLRTRRLLVKQGKSGPSIEFPLAEDVKLLATLHDMPGASFPVVLNREVKQIAIGTNVAIEMGMEGNRLVVRSVIYNALHKR